MELRTSQANQHHGKKSVGARDSAQRQFGSPKAGGGLGWGTPRGGSSPSGSARLGRSQKDGLPSRSRACMSAGLKAIDSRTRGGAARSLPLQIETSRILEWYRYRRSELQCLRLRESLATVVTYAYSRRDTSSRWIDRPFLKTAEQQAERACIEMAALGRALIWAQPSPEMAQEYKRGGIPLELAPVGWMDRPSGERADLTASDAFNKIIHAASFDWGFDGGG